MARPGGFGIAQPCFLNCYNASGSATVIGNALVFDATGAAVTALNTDTAFLGVDVIQPATVSLMFPAGVALQAVENGRQLQVASYGKTKGLVLGIAGMAIGDLLEGIDGQDYLVKSGEQTNITKNHFAKILEAYTTAATKVCDIFMILGGEV